MLDTVTVACKLPNGLILHTHPDGGAKVELKLKGNRHRTDAAGVPIITHEVASGYGLTKNVPRELWERMQAESADTPPFKAGLVFALNDDASTKAMAQEVTGDFKSGLEPLDPAKPGPGLEPVKET